MKHKLNKILLLYLFTGTLFVSCTMEEERSLNNPEAKIKVTQKKFSELMQTSSFKKAMSKIPKQVKVKSNFDGKTVIEEQYGFTIIDALVKTTNTDDFIIHNILVKSDTLFQGNYFENLVININKSNNQLKAYIVKYNLLENITESNHNSFNLNATRSVKEITYNDTQSNTGKEVIPCYDIQVLMCSNDGAGNYTSEAHPVGTNCYNNTSFHFWQTVSSGCGGGGPTDTVTLDPIDTSGGVGGTTGPTSGNNSTGNTTSEYTSILLENPTPLCDTCPEFTGDNPCIRLVNKTSSATYKQKFKDLNVPANYNSTQESGFGEVVVNGQSQYIDCVPNGQDELIPPAGSINLTHIHNNIPKTDEAGTPYDGRIKILAPGDISVLVRNCQPANGNDFQNAFVVMASNEGVFAITMTEQFSLNLTTITRESWNNFRSKYDKRGKTINTDPYLNAASRKVALQIMLLEELKAIGFENKIALFEGTIENENDPDINNYNIKWTQKKLDKGLLSKKLKLIPCN